MNIGCCGVKVPLHSVSLNNIQHYWCDDCHYLYSVTSQGLLGSKITVNREEYFDQLGVATPWEPHSNRSIEMLDERIESLRAELKEAQGPLMLTRENFRSKITKLSKLKQLLTGEINMEEYLK